MVRIGGGVFPVIKEPNYLVNGEYRVDKGATPKMPRLLLFLDLLKPPRMFGMRQPPTKIDPNQIPRPIPSSSPIVYETRQGNSANPPPPATSDYIVRDTRNCAPCYMRCTTNQVVILGKVVLFSVPIAKCPQNLELLLENIPTMFQSSTTAKSCFAAAIKVHIMHSLFNDFYINRLE
ncbi:hypothetical protein PVK06_030142 [Gossypium arboreum]|uniref:Uncharacterized protein n=1 Tax=Gossypium arboreum TaxID=29729 RepID=A0ABR0NNK8_GOSAR|nr:hypothetical protein PVK06_030142 [Gossypium arboreum]